MKVCVLKGSDCNLIIPIDFVCAPICCDFSAKIQKVLTKEYYRTLVTLDKNLPENCAFLVEKTISVNAPIKNFDKQLFLGFNYANKLLKEFKTLFLQNAFYFKSLTDNFSENNREIAVKAYIDSVNKTMLSFDGTIGDGGLMETAFSAFSFIDEVNDKSAYLLTLIARTNFIASTVFINFGSAEHNPFLFSEENFIK